MTAPANVVLMVNPTSGKGRGGKNAPEVAATLRGAGIEVTEISAHSADVAIAETQQALEDGAEALIACGGDGTIHAALQLVAGTSTPLGIIPVGTGDDNARTLNIPLNDVAAASRLIVDGHTREVDCGHITTSDGTKRWFLGVMSSGFDSLVNERANQLRWPTGTARYLVATLAELRVFQPLPYTVQIDGEDHNGVAMLVTVGNGISYGGGMKVCPNADVTDGLLDVTFLGELGKLKFLQLFGTVFKGTHIHHESVQTFRGKEIHLDAPDQIAYADGERIGPLPITVTIQPKAVRVFGSAP